MRSLRLWIPSAVIAFVTVGTEFLPIVFGTGEDARWDWSFVYVTLHFIALPLASVGLIVVSAVVLSAALRRHEASAVASAALAMLVPVGYLVLLAFHPLFWFGRVAP